MHERLLDPIDPISYKYLPIWQHKKETEGKLETISRLRGRRRKHRAEVSHHLLMLTRLMTLNTINTLLEMLECSLLLIHTLLYVLESLLEVIKPRSDSSLILIHVLLHKVEARVMD